jgi:hypothetical protein
MIYCICIIETKHYCIVINTPGLYLEDLHLILVQDANYLVPCSHCFVQPASPILWQYLKTGHDCFLLFLNWYSVILPFDHHNVWRWESIIKYLKAKFIKLPLGRSKDIWFLHSDITVSFYPEFSSGQVFLILL